MLIATYRFTAKLQLTTLAYYFHRVKRFWDCQSPAKRVKMSRVGPLIRVYVTHALTQGRGDDGEQGLKPRRRL
jgi:hypothetical protein